MSNTPDYTNQLVEERRVMQRNLTSVLDKLSRCDSSIVNDIRDIDKHFLFIKSIPPNNTHQWDLAAGGVNQLKSVYDDMIRMYGSECKCSVSDIASFELNELKARIQML